MKSYKCLLITEEEGRFSQTIATRSLDDLPAGDVLIRVHYSSLNYKDAMSATGKKGVTPKYPHTPGIDAAGVVELSTDSRYQAGDEVLVTGFDLGMGTSGGFAQYIRVPADWVVKLPIGLSLRDSMVYGTAGFTAGLSVGALLNNGVSPQKGIVAVTGASGGVGSLAAAMLKKLGFRVAAISGKGNISSFFGSIGVDEIIPRAEIEESFGRPLLKPRFAGVVDTVGGKMLAALLSSLQYGGAASTCGMLNGTEVPASIFPFILRGVKLIGIDSVQLPLEERLQIWEHLATDWRPANLEVSEITLEELPTVFNSILNGQMKGKCVVRID
ncbi:MAG: YhdH/YhfP family quinone oxidoreductase [Niabella sp.]